MVLRAVCGKSLLMQCYIDCSWTLCANRPFYLVCFVFPIPSTWYSLGNLAFVFSLVMHAYVRGCTWMGRDLKETVLLGNITWSAMGKQNIQAKKSIKRFHSRGQHLWKFIGTKESVCIRKEFNSHGIGLVHQHGRRFIVLGHQYGRCDVMWKHSIGKLL